jgi:hypothetical protein
MIALKLIAVFVGAAVLIGVSSPGFSSELILAIVTCLT